MSNSTETVQAFPLQWPTGWRRCESHERERAKFGKSVAQYRTKYVNGVAAGTEHSYDRRESLSIAEATKRVLELSGPNPTRAELDAQHRRLAMKHHPDRGGDAERMADINAARDQGLGAIR